ncbi:MAG: L,D-transpeptidase [Deltaproteobacteria bacterium]|nr:L,D-transpeptidase [Deltaproteobacteria bacterium]
MAADRQSRPRQRPARAEFARWLACGLVVSTLLVPTSGAPGVFPRIVISRASYTLRLEQSPGRVRVFPVGLGRSPREEREGPTGTLFTGTDPEDREFYDPARREPAYLGGLPFLRLDGVTRRQAGRIVRPYGIHGPVTPTLIWGPVSAGCVRMRPSELRELFRLARRRPRIPVVFTDAPDAEAERRLAAAGNSTDCPESGIGVRRMGRLGPGAAHHDRSCGGVDHWYAITLQSGDLVSAELDHDGSLRLELYGLRAISTLANGTRRVLHRVPRLARYRGERYLRVVAPASPGSHPRGAVPYSLRVAVLGAP